MFNKAQIRQYKMIWERWFNNYKKALPRRLDIEVVTHAIAHGLVYRNNKGTLYCNHQYGHYNGLDLPVEVLWAIVEPAVRQHSGFSITKERKLWVDLNLETYPIEKLADSAEQVLMKLDWHGYINFQAAGHIWSINVVEKGDN